MSEEIKWTLEKAREVCGPIPKDNILTIAEARGFLKGYAANEDKLSQLEQNIRELVMAGQETRDRLSIYTQGDHAGQTHLGLKCITCEEMLAIKKFDESLLKVPSELRAEK